MMRFIGILLFTCANATTFAQVNFVKNPSFEDTVKCPNEINQINYARYWTCAVDTLGEPYYAPEYYTAGCEPPNTRVSVPNNVAFYQYPHTGKGVVGAVLYYDKTLPIPGGVTSKWRDYFQGRLHKTLKAGTTYCVSFWVNLAEASGYAHNEIGAYIDNGNINKAGSIAGEEITFVIPQVHSSTVIDDTARWTKIEGNFIAAGNETHITLGTFSKNEDIIAISNTWGWADQYSYYLFDDVSVIPIDLKADAGKDSHAEPGKPVQIGRVGDTTAMGLDCKWYYKSTLIDSGAVISVNGSAIVGTVDTYVVVQTICGLSKTDTVTVTTVPLGLPLPGGVRGGFVVYPNPSNGVFTITSTTVIPTKEESLHAVVYDVLGRVVVRQQLSFKDNDAQIRIQAPKGNYILELSDEEGNTTHERIIIE